MKEEKKQAEEPKDEETTQPLEPVHDLVHELAFLKARVKRLELHCFPHAVEGDK